MNVVRQYTLILFVIMLCIAGGGHRAAAFEAAELADGPVAKGHFKRQVTALFYQDNFSALEEMAVKLRSEKAKFPDGTWQLYSFYDGFAHPRNRSDEGWQRFLSRFDSWLARYPDSVTARTAAATAWMAYGWQGRGGDYADKVTPEGWRLFRERLQKAYDYASIKPKKLADDCPQRYDILLSLGVYQGMDRFHFESLFNEATSSFPEYNLYYYQTKAGYLRPSWHGSMAELQEFLSKTASLPPELGVKGIYAIIVATYWGLEFTSFEKDRIPWQLVKQGFEDLRRKAPRSPILLNMYCEVACRAGDRETARALFREIGDRPYLEFWNYLLRPAEFLKWRDWAFAGEKTAWDTTFANGTEDFRQQFLCAEKGDAECQYQVGLMLERGDVVKKDLNESVIWFKKAALQGHRDAQTSLASYYFNTEKDGQRQYAEAARWDYIAAMQGDSNAASSLGRMYMSGNELAPDLIKAYVWYSLVTQWKDPHVKEIAAKLTPEQLGEAEKEISQLRAAINANMRAAEVRPIDPSTIKVPEFKQVPPVVFVAAPQLKLPTGNLLTGITWALSGGASFDGTTLTIKGKGDATAKMKVTPATDGCVLIGMRLRLPPTEQNGKAAPFLMASMMNGTFEESQRIYMGLVGPLPVSAQPVPWYKVHKVEANAFDGVKVRLGMVAQPEEQHTEFTDMRVMIFKTCEEASKAAEGYQRQ